MPARKIAAGAVRALVIYVLLSCAAAAETIVSTEMLLDEIARAPVQTPQQRLSVIAIKMAVLERLASGGGMQDGERALALYDSLIADMEQVYGREDSRLIGPLRAAGMLNHRYGKDDKALRLLERARRLANIAFGPDDPAIRFVLAELAEVYASAGRAAAAQAARSQAERMEQIAVASVQGSDTLGAGAPPDAPQAGYQIVPVHFDTTRSATASRDPQARFGEERAPRDSFGISYVSVPRKRDIGTIPRPSIFRLDFSADPNRHVMLKEVVAIDSAAAFFGSVRGKLASSERKEVLIYVHGFNQSFANSMETAATLAVDLEIDGAVIAYSWPSKNNLLRYKADLDEATAIRNQEALRDLFVQTAAIPGTKHVYVVAHSMGNRVLLEAIKLMAPAAAPYFDSVVYASPDVESHDFVDLVPKSIPFASRLTLYTAKDDLALGFSATLGNAIFGESRTMRAGDAGAGIVSTPYLDVVDASAVKADWLGHGDFAYLAKDDLRALFWFGMRAENRCVLSREPSGNWRYAGPAQCPSAAFQLASLYRRRLGSISSAIEQLAQTPGATPDLAKQILQRWLTISAPQ